MLHLLTSPIPHGRSLIPAFDVGGLRLVEGIYVSEFIKQGHCTDIETAFLFKTGRRPNQAEIDFQVRIKNGEKTYAGIYESNWHTYCSQAIHDKHGILNPSTAYIRKIYKEVLGYYPSYDNTHIIGRLVRYRKYDLLVGYFISNTWQLMGIVAAMDAIGVARKASSISALFNKIYKREPREFEVELCKKLDLTKSTEDIRNEITAVITVKGEANYRRTWRNR